MQNLAKLHPSKSHEYWQASILQEAVLVYEGGIALSIYPIPQRHPPLHAIETTHGPHMAQTHCGSLRVIGRGRTEEIAPRCFQVQIPRSELAESGGLSWESAWVSMQ